MQVSNFTRLKDARPNFRLEKFQMPKTSFSSGINTIKPIITATDLNEISSPIKPTLESMTSNVKPPRFTPGQITTGIVIGAIAVIIITTIYINQTSKNTENVR